MKKLSHSSQIKIFVGLLCLLLIVLLALLWNEYRGLKRQNIINAHQTALSNLSHRGPLTAADADSIEPWMTFDYIDFAFKLPSTYLQTALTINNPQFPRITLYRYAKAAGIDSTQLLQNVRNAVRTYTP